MGAPSTGRIWHIAVVNCLLFSEHATPFSRAGSGVNSVLFSEQRGYWLRVTLWEEQDMLYYPSNKFLHSHPALFRYLTNVLQVLDVVSLCAYDLIDDIGPHLVFGGLPHPKAAGATAGVVLFAALYLQGIIFHGLILVYSQLCQTHKMFTVRAVNTALSRKRSWGQLTERQTKTELG